MLTWTPGIDSEQPGTSSQPQDTQKEAVREILQDHHVPFLSWHLQHSLTQKFIALLPPLVFPRQAQTRDLPVTKERRS